MASEMTNIEIRDFQTVSGVGEGDFVVLSLSGGSSAKMAVGMFTASVSSNVAPSIKDGMWWIGSVNTEVTAEGKTPEFRRGDMGIEYKYTTDDGTAWKLLVGLDEIRFRYEDLTEEQRGELVLKYSDLTEDEIAELQKPAKDMVDELSQTNSRIQEAESSRQTVFEDLREEMESATASANDTADHPTYVGSDYYVYRWNKSSRTYDKTDVYVKGEALSIKKVYSSVDEMNADISSSFREGDFCLINTGNVEDEENAQLFVRTSAGEWEFMVDMSGASGFTGKTPQMFVGKVTVGSGKGSAEVTLASDGVDTDGNPKYLINYVIPCLDYEDLTQDQVADLQRPASEMISHLQTIGDAVTLAEEARVVSENERADEFFRLKAESEVATSNATGAAESANDAAGIANEAASTANDAANEANMAALKARNLPIIQSGTWWLYDVQQDSYVDTGYAVSSDYQLTKEKIENVFTGNISTHHHDRYVDKVEGKGLSTEDFTTFLKEKLEGLNNYDDSSINETVNKLSESLDSLIGGNLSDAIESFNEVVSFLEGISDTKNLGGIIASIQTEISKKADPSDIPLKVSELENDALYVTVGQLAEELEQKQDSIEDLDDIRRGALLGLTSIQEHQDISGLATKTELSEEMEDKLGKMEAIDTYQPKGDYAERSDIITVTDGGGAKYLSDDGTYKEVDALPKGGTAGQVLAKTEDGAGWTDMDLSEYATNKSVDDKISAIPKVDLEPYITEEELSNALAGFDLSIPVVDHGTDDTIFELTPNILHRWGTVTSLELTLADANNTDVVAYYMVEFTSGTTATTLTFPDTVKWPGDLNIESGKTYQISIMNNLGAIGGF